MSRQLDDVATLLPLQWMSRQLIDVATLTSLQADVATASDAVLMLRPLPDVATSMFSQLYILCHDFYLVSRQLCPLHMGLILSRPHVFFFINSWLPDLEFLSRPAHFAFNYSSVATGVLSSRP